MATIMSTIMRALRHGASLLLAVAGLLAAGTSWAQDAASLRTHYETLKAGLDASPFGRPLVLESNQKSDQLVGDVYARVVQPFTTVRPNLQGAVAWCDILILHLNVKGCSSAGNELSVVVGRKFDQPLADGYRVKFTYKLITDRPDYLQVQLTAADGPMGTSDYRITLEAVPLDDKTSFMHMSYSYGYGTMARLAMQTYLSTIGRDKVGFTVTGKTPDGQPIHVDGVRAVLERNTMRYYLAIDAYLKSVGLPPEQQLTARLADWFDSGERYARQLHEIERDDYLTMKRNEVRRQRAAP
jgi:hypothetical protein